MDRIIFHIDVNSAFLSWTALEQLSHGSETDLRLVPSIVGGDMEKRHGVVLAKSIPAKAYGIVTGEPVVNAIRKCPNLLIVPPNHELYENYSQTMMDFLHNICPDIEQASVDECYMDFTPVAHLYPSPEKAAEIIKNDIYERFGFSVNIGISDRKVLAKMASDFRKPNLVHTLYAREIQAKLWPLPVSSLFMCGRSSAESLRKLEILTIGDLARADQNTLLAHLKSHGRVLWEFANGIDDSPVVTEPYKPKGIGNSTTLSKDVTEREEACRVLLQLAESVGRRLRESGDIAGLVCTEIKYSNFQSVSHQMTLPVPTSANDVIYKAAVDLFDELWNHTPIRLLGVRTSRLLPEDEPIQISLFDLQTKPSSAKHQQLDAALDSIRTKFGTDAIVRGSFMKNRDKL